ncbi:MAG: coenzyme F420-reducing hydrogenase [Thermoplasmata archaeon M9B1D]|nr:MAG: coenzyme F420-reducing hydrogenase [Thermoplasmata archaeon M9B1D]PNX52126.1 MAG: coenzyme F420-reducing hydrogenase [Thermoplasmata archaeon M8B2D]
MVKKVDFKRSKKWENELDKCIRCGYCYELCPLFKSYSWESDTPRGKLLMVHGMITGKIAPTQEVVDKIFQCFYCKNCSDNCSAGVPVTDILTDARADLINAGFEVQGTIVQIDEDLCSVCGVCVPLCKYDALKIVDKGKDKKKIEVDKVECRGCGLCLAACPSGAISQKEGCNVTLPELHESVKEILKKDDKKLLVFACNYSIFPGMQLSETETLVKTPYGIIVTMCSGRVAPELILDAFESGAWGVMVAGCPPEECDHDGNYKTRRRLILLKNILKELNINPKRLKLDWFSTGESAKLQQEINKFVKELENMGPIEAYVKR